MLVKKIDLYTIFDSLGNKTIEASLEVTLAGKNLNLLSSSPYGASKSKYEAPVIPIEKGLKSFNPLRRSLCTNHTQESFDKILRKNINKLGSHITTALSLAFFTAQQPKKTFPNPLGVVFEGGLHSHSHKSWIQEILVMPNKPDLVSSLETNFNIWKDVKDTLHVQGRGFESGWFIDISSEKALNKISDIAKHHKAKIGIDIAASSIYSNGKYHLPDKELNSERYLDHIIDITKNHNLFYVEDPFHQDDFKSFTEFRKKTRALVCGDDLISSNMTRLSRAMKTNSINTTIIKPNQIGTVTDCLKMMEFCKKKKITAVVSHRAGETDSDSKAMALLAQNAPLAKFGIAGERINKLNELLRMWHTTKGRRMSRI
ncbi:MAG: hypothetical protein ABIA21_02595 [Candidatus Aenigmatarchaeota archaeon]